MTHTLARAAISATLFTALACAGGDDGGMCNSARGNLLTPPKPGAVVMDYEGPGLALITRPAGQPALPMLLVDAESVRTSGRKSEACSVNQGFYGCGAEGNFKSIVVRHGGLRWSVANRCRWYEDSQDILLEAPKCIPPGTIVVEGDLLDYDASLSTPEVMLTGPRQRLAESAGASGDEDHRYTVGMPCSVEDGHYACPTLGYLSTAAHSVIVEGSASEVVLPVTNCVAEKVRLDVHGGGREMALMRE